MFCIVRTWNGKPEHVISHSEATKHPTDTLENTKEAIRAWVESFAETEGYDVREEQPGEKPKTPWGLVVVYEPGQEQGFWPMEIKDGI